MAVAMSSACAHFNMSGIMRMRRVYVHSALHIQICNAGYAKGACSMQVEDPTKICSAPYYNEVEHMYMKYTKCK